jgi:hypothetical protein
MRMLHPEESMGPHPSPDALDRLFAGQLDAPAARSLVAHLLECGPCRSSARSRLTESASDSYRTAFSEGTGEALREERVLALSRLQATSLWAELEPLAPTQRSILVAADERFREWALVDRLLELANDRGVDDRHAGLALAELALLLVGLLRPSRYPEALLADKRAAVLAALAGARRRTGDWRGAEAALSGARTALGSGSGDPLEDANLLHLEARLQLDLGQSDAAIRPLRRAAAIYHRLGEPAREGQVALLWAHAEGHRAPARGVELARRALSLFDAGSEPRGALAARHALIWFLNDSGASHEALSLLDEARPLYRQLGLTPPAFQQRWLEARIGYRLGNLEAAEQTYRSVWREFRSAGFNQDLTLVSLNLAEVFVRQDRTRRAALLLSTYESTLRRFKMHPDGLTLWGDLRASVADETDRTLGRLHDAALYFREAWCRPLLRRAA